jgi:hypothetical protein
MTGLRGAGATFPSYALAIGGGNPIVNIRNNIFYNTQTSGSTGKSYAIANAATTFTNMTSSYNDLFVTGASGFVGQTGGLGTAGTDRLDLAAWNTATGQDAAPNSQSVDPIFVNPASDLHLNGATTTLLDDGITGDTAIDFDGDARENPLPDVGADELLNNAGGAGTYYNARLGGVSLGGNVTITNTLFLTGIVNTTGNTLTIACGATVNGAGATNYVIGNVAKEFCGTDTFTFPVGTLPDGSLGSTPEYSPVDITLTAIATIPSTLTVSATDNFLPGLVQNGAVSRFWTVTETGAVTADMTFHYLDQDINGVESDYKVFRRSGGFTTEIVPNSNNPAANTASVTGVTAFSDWGIGKNVPSASTAVLAGRVLTADGRGIRNVTMAIEGGNLIGRRYVRTSSFGWFTFDDLRAGETYVVTVNSKRYLFQLPSRVVTLSDSVSDVDFIAEPF